MNKWNYFRISGFQKNWILDTETERVPSVQFKEDTNTAAQCKHLKNIPYTWENVKSGTVTEPKYIFPIQIHIGAQKYECHLN